MYSSRKLSDQPHNMQSRSEGPEMVGGWMASWWVPLVQRELKRCILFLGQMCRYLRLDLNSRRKIKRAVHKGARFLIIGKAITMTEDPLQAARSFRFAAQKAEAHTKAKIHNEK